MYPKHDANRAKRTYTISERIVKRFESLVPPGQRSQTVERLLNAECEAAVREKRRAEIAEGLADMAEVYEEIARDWKAADNDGWPTE